MIARRMMLGAGALLLALYAAATGRGQENVEVLENRVTVTFPQEITFQLEIASGNDVAVAGLRYGTEGRTCQPTGAYQPVEAGDDGTTFSWTWELARFGTLPARTTVWWEWELEDDAGNTVTTPRQRIELVDDNYTFNQLSSDGINIYWAEGDEAFGNFLLTLTRQRLVQLEREMGVEVPRPVRLIVYPDPEAVRTALIKVPEWTGGVALARYSTIVAGIPPTERDWAEDVLSHEIGHLVVGAATFNCVGQYVPTWLNEGLAVYAEGPLSTSYREVAEAYLAEGELPRLRTLAEGFSAYSGDANLAYAQSAYVVRYLIESEGPRQMGLLLSEIQSGEDVDDALQTVYGFDTDGLDSAWRQSLGYEALPTRPSVTATPTGVPTLAPLTLSLTTSSPTVPAPTPTATVTETPVPTPSPTVVGTATPQEVAAAPTAAPSPQVTEPVPDSTATAPIVEETPQSPWLLYGVLAVGVLLLLLAWQGVGRRR